MSVNQDYQQATTSALRLTSRANTLGDLIANAQPGNAAPFVAAIGRINEIQECLNSLRDPIKRLASQPNVNWVKDGMGRWGEFAAGVVAGIVFAVAFL